MDNGADRRGKDMDRILAEYYEDNGRKLRGAVDRILSGFGGIWDKDRDDFYSLANEVFVDAMGRCKDGERFDGLLHSCLTNRIKTEMTRRNREKRMADRLSVSLDAPVGDGDLTVGDIVRSDFDLESMFIENMEGLYGRRMERYLESLSGIQRRIMEMKMEEVPDPEIRRRLDLSARQYRENLSWATSFEKICILRGGAERMDAGWKKRKRAETGSARQGERERAERAFAGQDWRDHGEEDKGKHIRFEEDRSMGDITQTKEKSKQDRLSAASIAKSMERHTLRFDHPLQRDSGQWSPSMKGNLISDILQGNPVPSLVFAEQVVNGTAIIWNLDGKQRCTNVYTYMKDGFRVSRNVRRWKIEYQTPARDEEGREIFDQNHFPVYEQKAFDIRGKRFSQLPEELRDRFCDYCFEIVQYLNCSGEDIAYHIARYNEGKVMTVSQKGITRIGEAYADRVKSISNMAFFRQVGNYRAAEFKSGTIHRVIIEGIMAANYLEDWKKRQEDMCGYLRTHGKAEDFDDFEDMADRLEKVVTGETAGIFDSRDSFLWFGLFARFGRYGLEDSRFAEFLTELVRSLHTREIDGVSFDDLNKKGTKDKRTVTEKMEWLERAMREYLRN